MRSWEKIDLVDILKDHHAELTKKSVKLSIQGFVGDFKEAQILDDKCIVIETYLEDVFGVEWTGLEFVSRSPSTT